MSSGAIEAGTDDPERVVEGLIERGRRAMEQIADYDQQQVDDLVRAVGWAVYEESRCREISELAVEQSGLGNADDKFAKKRRKIEGTLDETTGEPSVGVIDRDEERGLTEIAKPVGVVGAVVPSTNPGATPTLLTMMALKGRNAIVLSPSPRGLAVCETVVEYMHEQLERVGAPTDLVTMVPPPVSKAKTYELMDRVDLLQVTGSGNNVRRGQESGTPNYCVGQGNPVSIIDETADLEATAARIAQSKTFDYGTSCSSEGNAAIVEPVYDEAVAALEAEGGYMCDAEERERLVETLFPDGKLNREAIAAPPADIAELAGLEAPAAREAEFLMTRGQGVGGEHPLSGEKIAPVLNVFEVADFEAALTLTRRVLDYEGAGHSAGVHTSDPERARRAGEAIDVARLLVNQVHSFGNGGHHTNGLGCTLSEGAGTWGGNQLDENVTYEQFIQTTTVSEPFEASPPDGEALFEPYHERYDTGGE
jgi:sulfoacetaldehyde dehydrogenase